VPYLRQCKIINTTIKKIAIARYIFSSFMEDIKTIIITIHDQNVSDAFDIHKLPSR